MKLTLYPGTLTESRVKHAWNIYMFRLGAPRFGTSRPLLWWIPIQLIRHDKRCQSVWEMSHSKKRYNKSGSKPAKQNEKQCGGQSSGARSSGFVVVSSSKMDWAQNVALNV